MYVYRLNKFSLKMIRYVCCRVEYELLEDVQARLVVDPLTAPILGNDHKEFRSRESRVSFFDKVRWKKFVIISVEK